MITCPTTGRTWPREAGIFLKDCKRCGGKINTWLEGWADTPNGPEHLSECPTRPPSTAELMKRLSTLDAAVWAHEFAVRFCNDAGRKQIDEGLMIGWFANCIAMTRQETLTTQEKSE